MKVLITGASRGLGYALASCFLDAGHTVLAGIRSIDSRMKLNKIKTIHPGKPDIFKLDVSDEKFVKKAAEYIGGKYEAIDILHCYVRKGWKTQCLCVG